MQQHLARTPFIIRLTMWFCAVRGHYFHIRKVPASSKTSRFKIG
jgi:hypothetical protein